MAIRAFWRHPFPWLLAQALVVLLALLSTDGLRPEMVPDTPSYRQTANSGSLDKALMSQRTLGYPLLFKLAGLRSGGRVDGSQVRHINLVTRRMPKIHALVYLAAVLTFWYGLSRYTESPWLAFAAALPLLYSNLWTLVRRIQPDFVASALALLAVSLLLLLAVRPRGRLLWIGVGLTVLLTYHVRPAYLFLVVLAPVAGAFLWWARGAAPPKRAARLGLGLLGITVAPFVLFCALRWLVVGHFGLVSFGGVNLIGITANFLDDDLTRQLPRHRELAESILRARQERGFEPYGLLDYAEPWHLEFHANVREIGLSAAKDARRTENGFGGRRAGRPRRPTLEINAQLSELSRDLIRARPFLYAKFVADSFVVCLDRALEMLWIRWPAILLALSWPLAGLARARRGAGDRRALAFVVVALAFFLLHAANVLLVIVPYERYLLAMVLLVPSALCAALFEVWKGASDRPPLPRSLSSPSRGERDAPARNPLR